MKKIIWDPMGNLELGILYDAPGTYAPGGVQGEFLGSPRHYEDWTDADARSELEAWRWHDSRQYEPDDPS